MRRWIERAVCVVSAICGLWIATTTVAIAQDDQLSNSNSRALDGLSAEVFVAPVVFEGNALFLVRGSSALPADQRAAAVAERLEAIAESSDSANVDVEIGDGEFGLVVTVDGEVASNVTVADASFERVDIGVLASSHAVAIENAILNYRLLRSQDARVDSAIAAVGWSIGFLVLTIVFFRLRQRLVRGVVRMTERRFVQVEEATGSIVRGKAVAALFGFSVKVLLWVGYLVAVYYYLSFVLLAFAETRPLAQVLLSYVSEPLINIGRGFVAFLPNLITLLIIAWVTRYLIQGLKLFFDNIEAGTFKLNDFEPHWIAPTFHISRIVIVLIALVFAYPFIPGSDSAAFQGLTILAGLMVSLGSNTVVSNMMAGLFVIYRRSTNVGDRIKVGDQVGDVVEIKLMETLIKSVKNEMISIPNAQLLNSEVVNYSRQIDGRGLLVHTTVGIGYEEPPEKVKAMLIEAARRTNGIRKSPAPFVLWKALADYAINYQINAFTGRGELLPKILSDLHENIMTVFTENGVQIMTPSYEADPPEPKIPPLQWDGKLAGAE